jgi:hypothetical protein
MKTKVMAVAGQFYSDNKEELDKQLTEFSEKYKKECDYFSKAIIVPHAGYTYSGSLAAKGYAYLKKDLETIFIFAPAHRVAIKTFAVSSADEMETPFGNVYIHKELSEAIVNMNGEYNDDAYISEHSIEVQLPFIKKFFPEVNIVPILVGGASQDDIYQIINKYWDNEKVGFVISSDLSHFNRKSEATRIDLATADMIENNVYQNLLPEQACGYKSVAALLKFTAEKNYAMIRVGITDSSEATHQPSNVVGYGSWYVAEEEKTAFLKKYFSEAIRQLVVLSLKSQIDNVNVQITTYPKALETRLATFVTYVENGILRGCIGSVVPHQSLIVDLCQNARNAAFKDPRFTPVEPKELDKLGFSVSLLGTPSKINFTSEEDLLEQLVPNEDGLIIKDAGRQALYLPEVWQQIPEKKDFLNSLKQKAGLKPDWFSDTFEAYRIKTQLI